MTILPTPHAGPLPSWASRPGVPPHGPASLPDALRLIIRWLFNRHPKPSPRDKQLEEAALTRIAEELEAEEEAMKKETVKEGTMREPKIQPRRPRRVERPH
jgi:hypothetical protein